MMKMYVSNEEETFFFVGNAEMTELFKCEKSKTTCCSPKSAIKEEKTRLQRIKYQIRRKDTEIQNTQFIEVRYDIHSSFVISIYLLLHFYPLFFGLILWIWNLLKFKYIPPLRPNMIHDTVNLSRRFGSYVNGGRTVFCKGLFFKNNQ